MKVNEDQNSGIQRDETSDELKAAHTVGPWEVSGATHIWSPTAHANVATVSEPRGEHSDVGYHPLERNSPDFEEACANAQLISAAPELFAALKWLVAVAGKTSLAGSNYSPALQQARRAIAKATGEQRRQTERNLLTRLNERGKADAAAKATGEQQ